MNAFCSVRTATLGDLAAWSALREALWSDADAATHADEIREDWGAARGTAVLAFDAAGAPIGLAEASVRSDYVNGTDTSPVAFLEGLYVVPAARRQGVGRALVAALETWARTQGHAEFASDAAIDNAASHAAHRAYGFEETERAVYFRKALGA